MIGDNPKKQDFSELSVELRRYRSALGTVAGVSALMNFLVLGGSIYMMLVYDLVLPGRSIPTLIGLLGIIVLVYLLQGALDIVRVRILSQIGGSFAQSLSARVYDCILRLPLRARANGDGTQPVRDLDAIRSFLSSSGPAAIIDLPWILFFVGILCLFHPLLGVTALIGGIILIGLTFLTDRATRQVSKLAVAASILRQSAIDNAFHQAETIRVLGMREPLVSRWSSIAGRHLAAQLRLADTGTTLSTVSRVFRMFLQSLVLTVGALLVIDGQATGGVIFASSILTARALAPVETAIANWRGFVAARQAWRRLGLLLEWLPPVVPMMALPVPTRDFACEGLWLTMPDRERPIVADVTFQLVAGQAVGVIGPSASGKSTLVRGLIGGWNATRGQVRLDGAALDQWDPDAIGKHFGYLPQSVQLLPGTIGENISRFERDVDPSHIIAATRAAGIHEIILRMPRGYDTMVGGEAEPLSAGQRQRIALARALFGNPFVVVLDEPNSNLDAEGEQALAEAVSGIRTRGGIAIVVAHRPNILKAVDTVLVLQEGRMQAFGPRDTILSRGKIGTNVTPIEGRAPATAARPQPVAME